MALCAAIFVVAGGAAFFHEYPDALIHNARAAEKPPLPIPPEKLPLPIPPEKDVQPQEPVTSFNNPDRFTVNGITVKKEDLLKAINDPNLLPPLYAPRNLPPLPDISGLSEAQIIKKMEAWEARAEKAAAAAEEEDARAAGAAAERTQALPGGRDKEEDGGPAARVRVPSPLTPDNFPQAWETLQEFAKEMAETPIQMEEEFKKEAERLGASSFDSPQTLRDAQILLRAASDLAGLDPANAAALGPDMLRRLQELTPRRLSDAVKAIQNMGPMDVSRLTNTGEVPIILLADAASKGVLGKLRKAFAAIPDSERTLAHLGGSAAVVNAIVNTNLDRPRRLPPDFLSEDSLLKIKKLGGPPTVFLPDPRDAPTNPLHKSRKVGKLYAAICPYTSCASGWAPAPGFLKPDNKYRDAHLAGPVPFKEDWGSDTDYLNPLYSPDVPPGVQGAKPPVNTTQSMPMLNTERLTALRLNTEKPSAANAHNPAASWMYENVCWMNPKKANEYGDDTQIYHHAGAAYREMTDLFKGAFACEKIFPRNLTNCFKLPYSVAPPGTGLISGTAEAALDCHPALWARLLVDSCTNQYIAPRAFFPVTKKYLLDDDGRQIGVTEKFCQPLKTTPVIGDSTTEIKAHKYLLSTFKAVLEKDYYPYFDIGEYPKVGPKVIRGLGKKFATELGPSGAAAWAAFEAADKLAETSQGWAGGGINLMSYFPYERISDVYHPFSPRYDFETSERARYSPRTFNLIPYMGYDEVGECTVRCSSVPVDILSFREKAFDDCIGCRISANTSCFWGEISELIFVANTCESMHDAKIVVFGVVIHLDPIWYLCRPLRPYRNLARAIDAVLDDDNPVSSSGDWRRGLYGYYALPAWWAGRGAWALTGYGFAPDCKTNRSKDGHWPMCSTKFDVPDMDPTNHCENCQKIKECCHGLAKPVPGINVLKIRTDAEKNMPEGYTFREYFGNHRPYMRWWDTGAEAGMEGLPTPDYYCPLGHMDTIVGIGREAQYHYGNPPPTGMMPVIVDAPGESCKIGGGGGVGFGCIPGYQVGTEDNPVPHGANSLTGWTELKLYQARCFQQHNLNCFCQQEKLFKQGRGEDAALLATGGEYQSLWEPLETDASGATVKGEKRSISQPYSFSWRGYVTDPNPGRSFPFWPSLADAEAKGILIKGMDNAMPGDILIWPPKLPADPDKEQYQQIPHVAMVTEAVTKAAGLTRRSAMPKINLNSLKDELLKQNQLLAALEERLQGFADQINQFIAKQNQLEDALKAFQAKLGSAFDSFMSFREGLQKKISDMDGALTDISNTLDTVVNKLDAEVSKMNDAQKAQFQKIQDLNRDLKSKQQELQQLMSKSADIQTPQDLARINDLKAEISKVNSSIAGALTELDTLKSSALNDIGGALDGILGKLGADLPTMSEAQKAQFQKAQDLNNALKAQQNELGQLMAKADGLKTPEDLARIDALNAGIAQTKASVSSTLAGLGVKIESGLGSLTDIQSEINKINQLSGQLSSLNRSIQDVSGLTGIQEQLEEFSDLLDDLDKVKRQLDRLKVLEREIQQQKRRAQHLVDQFTKGLTEAEELDKLSEDLNKGVAGAQEKIDAIMGGKKDVFVRVVDFNHGKIPDACGGTNMWHSGVERTIHSNKSAGVGDDIKAKAKGSLLSGTNCVGGVEDCLDRLPARRATTSCIDPGMSDCEDPFWNEVLIYRIAKDARGECAALIGKTYNDTKAVNVLAPGAAADALRPIEECISKGFDPPKALLSRGGISQAMKTRLPNMLKQGLCSPKVGHALSGVPSGAMDALNGGAQDTGCPAFNKSNRPIINLAKAKIIAQGRPIKIESIPVPTNGKVASLPCGGGINLVSITVLNLSKTIKVIDASNAKQEVSKFFTGMVNDLLRGLLGSFCPTNLIGQVFKKALTIVFDTYGPKSEDENADGSVYAYIRPHPGANVFIPPWGGVEIDVAGGGGTVTLPAGGRFMAAGGEIVLKDSVTLTVNEEGTVFLSDGRVAQVAGERPLRIDADSVIVPVRRESRAAYVGDGRISIRDNKLVAPEFGSVMAIPDGGGVEIEVAGGGGTVTLPYNGTFYDIKGKQVLIRAPTTLYVDSRGNAVLSDGRRFRVAPDKLSIETNAVQVPPGTGIPLPKNAEVVQPMPMQVLTFE